MFAANSEKKLSGFATYFANIERDCEFFCVGKMPTMISRKLVPFTNGRYLRELNNNIDSISGVICTAELVDKVPEGLGCAVADEPVQVAYKIHAALCLEDDYYWASFPSKIAGSAEIHPTAYVADHDVVIGDGVVVGPNATIMPRSVIGENSIVGPNTVIGTDAYEISTIDGTPQLLKQAGGVRIGRGGVFLGGVTIARSTFAVFTEIGDYCSFDNNVHVAHDCILGEGVKMAACSMLSGRVTLGDKAYLGPNSTVSNGLSIGAGASVTIGAVVARDVPEGATVTGNFAVDHSLFVKNFRSIMRPKK
ncbi:hypothetical protein P9J64_05045 [Deltaproteobacteria bacterium IMCC39524]|nr:hypothetical protein [Deltaproteobacteria bacterium IMCC39524]